MITMCQHAGCVSAAGLDGVHCWSHSDLPVSAVKFHIPAVGPGHTAATQKNCECCP